MSIKIKVFWGTTPKLFIFFY